MKTPQLITFALLILTAKTYADWNRFKNMDEESVKRLQLTLSDEASMTAFLQSEMSMIEGISFEDMKHFTEKFSISPGIMRNSLYRLYESSRQKMQISKDERQQQRIQKDLCFTAAWLGVCADDQAKGLLLQISANTSDSLLTRVYAFASYLRAADPEESKNALLRFLVEDDRMDGMARLSLYSHAQTVYEESSPDKKAAILAALLAAAQKEEGKIEFMKVDKILCERSPMYRQSQERLRLLEQHNQEPPTTNLYTDRDLKAALEEARSHAGYTTLGTNLAALALLDSPQPHQIVPNPVIAQKDRDKKSAKRRWIIIGVSLVTGLAAATGFWLYRKKRAV